MLLLPRKKQREVQGFVLKVLNNNCSELEARIEGPRLDRRVNLTIAVLVVPVEGKTPQVDDAFAAVTKGFSVNGLAIVLDEPKGLQDVIVGFRWEREMRFVRATAKHLSPLGGGFFQLGLQLTEIAHVSDYPKLKSLSI